MLCDYILQYASATLAGEKPASLFRVPHPLWDTDSNILSILPAAHLQCVPVQTSRESVLLYLYNPALLNQTLMRPEINAYLSSLGYLPHSDIYCYLPALLQKIRSGQAFPHEIGLFLGYPLKDVQKYIENKGENCLYNKYWKVYDNVETAKRIFDKYDACRNLRQNARQEGASFEEILRL